MAERELSRRLASVLAQTGTPALTWYAVQRLSVFDSAPTAGDYRADLTNTLDLDRPAAAALLDELLATGLMHQLGDPAGSDTRIGLTAAGQALQASIRASIAAGTAELVGPFDPADIDTTIRTLTALTERARALRDAR